MRGAEAARRDVSSFVSESAVHAAQRELADREVFVLDEDRAARWDFLMERPARDLPGLRELSARLRRGQGRHTQPAVLITRLGVDLGHEGRGWGAGLL